MISCSTPNHSTEPTSSSCRQDLVSSTSSCKVQSLHLSHTEILLVVLTQPWTLTASRICIYGANTQTFTCALSDICRWYRNRKYYGAIRRVSYRQITAVPHSRRHLSGERLFIQVDARCSACRPCDDITNRHFSITALVTQIFSSFPRFSLLCLGPFVLIPFLPTFSRASCRSTRAAVKASVCTSTQRARLDPSGLLLLPSGTFVVSHTVCETASTLLDS